MKDLATMEIVGWAMSDSLKSALCEDALKMAIRNRHPSPGLIVHTDRGVQYACDSYRKLLGLHKLKASPLVHVNMHCRAVNEPQGQLLGQRTNGELFQFSENRDGPPYALQNQARGQSRAL